jgi:hypothetical protein
MELSNYIYGCDEVVEKKFTFNLTKAQKLLTKFKIHIEKNKSDIHVDNYFYKVNNHTISLNDSNEKILEYIDEKDMLLNEKYQNYNLIMVDYINLKALVHKKNSDVGLSQILSELEFFIQLKKNYETFQSQFNNLNARVKVISTDDIEYIKSKELLKTDPYSESVSHKVSSFEKDKIDKLVKKISKELDVLENKRDRLNATSEITFNLSSVSCDTFGLF